MPASSGAAFVRAPAKVNLYLRVLGRRPDGYHELDSLMFAVSLYDELTIQVNPSRRRAISCRVSGAERVAGGASNLAARAAAAMLEHLGVRCRVAIRLRKNVPFGAGLGGGSSDAAAVLRVLPRLLGRRLPAATLRAMALRLGADVPFFLTCRPARARGIGERLSLVAGVPEGALAIVVPPSRVDTGWAYRTALPGLTSGRSVSRLPPLPRRLDAVDSWFFNDFGVGIERAVPEVRVCRERLARLGARATVLSGSGSAVVGWFDDMAAAKAAASSFAPPDKAYAARILRSAPRPQSALAAALENRGRNRG